MTRKISKCPQYSVTNTTIEEHRKCTGRQRRIKVSKRESRKVSKLFKA